MIVDRLEATEANGMAIAHFLASTFAKEHRFGSQRTAGVNIDRSWQHIWRTFTEGVVWALREGDEIIGSISVVPDELWWTDVSYLRDGWFYVRPEWRTPAAAAVLIDAASRYADELVQPLVIMPFNADRPELVGRFLRRFGFVALGGLYIKEQ